MLALGEQPSDGPPQERSRRGGGNSGLAHMLLPKDCAELSGRSVVRCRPSCPRRLRPRSFFGTRIVFQATENRSSFLSVTFRIRHAVRMCNRGRCYPGISDWGHWRRFDTLPATSGLPRGTNIVRSVRLVPRVDIDTIDRAKGDGRLAAKVDQMRVDQAGEQGRRFSASSVTPDPPRRAIQYLPGINRPAR